MAHSDKLLPLGQGQTLIMGALNVTPDSFSDGGLFFDFEEAVAHAHRMVAEGADLIDVGGESSRPGADFVSVEEELRRVGPVIERLGAELRVPLSIDTCKPEVAEECLRLGARIVNDITGLRDGRMIEVAQKRNAGVVIMHMRGTPKTMQEDIEYDDVVAEVKTFLAQQTDRARQGGLREIILDPGIGFGKTVEHNLQILKRLSEFKALGCPILIGPSRKSFLAKICGDSEARDRLEGTLAAVSVGVMNGADIVRVHDVEACRKTVALLDAVRLA